MGRSQPLKIRILAWVYVLFGGAGLTVAGLILAAFLINFDPEYIDELGVLLWVAGGISLVYMLPAFLGGLGLLKGWTWARALVWMTAALLAPLVPLGTVMSGLALWALLSTRAEMQNAGDADILQFEYIVRRWARPFGLGLLALASLGVIVGIGYLFRDYIPDRTPKQELTPLPSGVPPQLPERPDFQMPKLPERPDLSRPQ